MSKEYKKCCNFGCERLCKRRIRCLICIKKSSYRCKDCGVELFNARAISCNGCYNKRRLAYCRQYGERYRAMRKSVTDQRLLVSIPQ